MSENEKPKIELPSGPIRETTAIRTLLRDGRSQYNIVGPVTEILSVPTDYQIVVRSVQFQLSDFYKVDGGNLALKKTSLDKLAAMLGISSVPHMCTVTRIELNIWFAEHVVAFKGLDGQPCFAKGSVEIDMTDEGEEFKAIVAKARSANPPRDPSREIQQVRRFGGRHAESKARLRAIRTALGIGALSEQDARKPFVAVSLVWSPVDPSPEIRRLIAEKELGFSQPSPTKAIPVNRIADPVAIETEIIEEEEGQ